MPGPEPRPDQDDLPALAAEALAEHPWIAQARVLDGVVRIRPRADALASRPQVGSLVSEYLDHWSELYDWTYEKAEGRHAGDLDLSGWRASDTGEPLPVDHMGEWVDRTVDLVLETRPELVLELGCGTGLLAHRLHGRVGGYVGTDVAPTAVAALTAAGLPGAAFVRAAAHEATAAPVAEALERVAGAGARPDCVLLNSVTQCFPDLGYLRAVLLDAIALVRPGGTVVVGDNRHSGLLAEYGGWVERAADPAASDAEIARRVARRGERDDELLFDPACLAEIAAASPREVRLSVRAKTMDADTELTRYRFDAVLRVEAADPPVVPRTVEWTGGEELERVLAQGPVRVTGIPHALLVSAPGARTPADLRRDLAGSDACVGLDPADPRTLEVHAPASAAFRPVRELLGRPRAHEPFHAFVERRLGEAARAHLRRHRPEARGVRVAVEAAS
ncbi:2-polyprenyl-3-methyl-5-hydroxy-6-metoxy-1,4-benzoquinol methylase [Nocardiopsis sp. Huas11]|uniref:class I SAM-dependent methyltransferase n=1 Tax=Nocardiopsis sp. Huas11 TaxID=2183912 RepID=UPI000EB4B0C1|nr:class I SAM-dependent methyltransferase [Nocardiopsis sp. Huas11]RKS09349.1 2-polyprenyl-3-methyl-5-hydroxy-6-metoxy-1,4-benzoquinol methylase [Nocardiopsis sp. Huas11]